MCTPPQVSQAERAWLIIPLYNEVPVVGDVIRNVRVLFPNVVCVDDGSDDASAAEAAAAGARVVRHAVNRGQGAALQTGIHYVLQFTNAEYLVTFDADGQHDASDAMAMLNLAIANDLAIVYGSRFLGNKVDIGWTKKLVLKTATHATRWRTKLRLTDAHNGLRLLRRDAAGVLQLSQDRMAHASEIVTQLARTNLPWAEAPVNIAYTDYSRKKGQTLFGSVNILFDMVLR